MDEGIAAIVYIVIPATLIAILIFMITKKKFLALRSISLYLFFSGVILLFKDVDTSYALFIGGILILIASFLTQIRDKNKNLLLTSIFSFVLIGIIFLYTIVWKFGLVSYSISAEITSKECFKDNESTIIILPNQKYVDMGPSFFQGPSPRCEMKVNMSISSPIPINKDFSVVLCGDNRYILFDKDDGYYTTFTHNNIEDINSSYLCVSYGYRCGECLVRKNFKDILKK